MLGSTLHARTTQLCFVVWTYFVVCIDVFDKTGSLVQMAAVISALHLLEANGRMAVGQQRGRGQQYQMAPRPLAHHASLPLPS